MCPVSAAACRMRVTSGLCRVHFGWCPELRFMEPQLQHELIESGATHLCAGAGGSRYHPECRTEAMDTRRLIVSVIVECKKWH